MDYLVLAIGAILASVAACQYLWNCKQWKRKGIYNRLKSLDNLKDDSKFIGKLSQLDSQSLRKLQASLDTEVYMTKQRNSKRRGWASWMIKQLKYVD